MVTSAYEFRKKLRAKKQKEFSKICHICKKELTINKEDVIFMIDDRSVHAHCFALRRKKCGI